MTAAKRAAIVRAIHVDDDLRPAWQLVEQLFALSEIESAAALLQIVEKVERDGYAQIGEECGIDEDDESSKPDRALVWFVSDKQSCNRSALLAALRALAAQLGPAE